MNRAAPAKRRRTKIPNRRLKQVLPACTAANQLAERSGGDKVVHCCLLMRRQNQAVSICEQQHDDHLEQHSVSSHEPHQPGDEPHFSD